MDGWNTDRRKNKLDRLNMFVFISYIMCFYADIRAQNAYGQITGVLLLLSETVTVITTYVHSKQNMF